MITAGGVFTTIRNATFTELGYLFEGGAISERALRNYYKEERKKAQSRISKLKSASVVNEYGQQEIPRFEPAKNLKSISDLLHEITDLNRFLRKDTSKVSGLKREKEARLNTLRERGINVNSSNYSEWAEFIKWFENSEYRYAFEYWGIEVRSVFDQASKSENAGPEDWEKLFNAYAEKYENNRVRKTKY